MDYLKINGGKPLNGAITLHGAKNSILPILSACVLVNGVCVLHNCPDLSDVDVTIDILKYLGANVIRENDTLIVDTRFINVFNIPERYMTRLRSSIVFLGALASKMGQACLFLPGGCEIGLRPIDLHLKGLNALGYEVYTNGHNVCARKNNVCGKEIVLPFPSVGATENIILASVLAKGTTTIVNAAREPEIEDLANFLNKCGAKISGANTPCIVVDGVEKLNGAEHTIIPDRILATTLMSAVTATKGDVYIKNVNISHIKPTVPVFEEMGCDMIFGKDNLRISLTRRPNKVKKIETLAFPGFPTDCQAPIMAALTIANGTSIIKETIFENRFMHTEQLNLFGADINIDGRIAIINGALSLHPADAVCTDLRGGAAVTIASLMAEGISTVKRIEHIDRGYEKIENQLNLLGADVKRIRYEKETKW